MRTSRRTFGASSASVSRRPEDAIDAARGSQQGVEGKTLLQLLNSRPFGQAVFGRERVIADSLGMSDVEFQNAEHRGFSPEQARKVAEVIGGLGFKL